MNNSKLVLLINDDARCIKAKYDDHEPPKLFKTFDQTIAEDDMVVVTTDTRHGFTVVKVTEVDVEIDFDKEETVRWIVQKVEMEAFKEVLDQEQEAISLVHSAERNRKKKELRESLFANNEAELKALSMAKVIEDE